MPELWLAVLEQWSYRTGGEIPVNFVLRVHLLHLLGDLVDRFFSTDNLGAMIGPMSDPSETDADDQLRFTVQFLYGDEPVPNVQRDIEFFPRMSYTLEEVVTLVEHTGLGGVSGRLEGVHLCVRLLQDPAGAITERPVGEFPRPRAVPPPQGSQQPILQPGHLRGQGAAAGGQPIPQPGVLQGQGAVAGGGQPIPQPGDPDREAQSRQWESVCN